MFLSQKTFKFMKKSFLHSLKTELIVVDIVESFTSVKEKLQLDMKIVSIAMKGSPTMLSQKSGFIEF